MVPASRLNSPKSLADRPPDETVYGQSAAMTKGSATRPTANRIRLRNREATLSSFEYSTVIERPKQPFRAHHAWSLILLYIPAALSLLLFYFLELFYLLELFPMRMQSTFNQFIRRISGPPSRVEAFGILLVLVCLYTARTNFSVGYQADGVVENPSQVERIFDSSNASENRPLYSSLARDSLQQESLSSRPIKRPELTDVYLDRFIVVPEYNLLFCYAEKVGCSMFNHLFRMLRLLHPSLFQNDTKLVEAQFQAHDTWFRNTPEHHNISKSELEDMLVDPTWTKATFFRDPATRFLSAYRSKCLLKESGRKHDHCRQSFGRPLLPWRTVSFDSALSKLDQHPEKVFVNEHFAPAHRFCGGLGNTLDYYDFVHQLTTPTAPDHIQKLFSILGVDSNTSDHLIQNVVKTGGTALNRDKVLLRERYPQGLELTGSRTQKKGHNTGSNKGNVLEDSYGSSEHLRVIYEHYGEDYDLFELPRLTLEELKKAGV